MSQRDHPAQPHRPDTFRFFCPKCLKAFQVEARTRTNCASARPAAR